MHDSSTRSRQATPLRLMPLLFLSWSSILSAQETASQSEVGARIDSIFAAEVRPGGPGCAIGVYREGELVLARGYGVVSTESGAAITPQTLFDLGSASKPFTALAVLTLEGQGRLSLDDDVRRYVPELPVYDAPIRIRDLLQHTSGLRDYGAMGELSGRHVATMQDFLDLLAGQRSLNFTPGSRHEYSHSDFVVLAIIAERVTGEPFGRYLEREVLRPLGMISSRVDDANGAGVPQRGYGHSGAGEDARVVFPTSTVTGGDNVYTSVHDLQWWDRALDQAATGRRPLGARLLERPTLPGGDTIPYAFGIRRADHRGLPVLTRGGHSDGMRTEFIHFPGQRFGVAVLCNAPHLAPGTLGERVAAEFLGGVMQPIQEWPAPPAVAATVEELERYTGVYGVAEGGGVKPDFTPSDITRFVIVDGRLTEVLLAGDTTQAMTYHGDGRFTYEGSPPAFQVRFTAAAGAPLRAEFSWQGEVQSVMERLADDAVWRPDAAALGEYAGRYHSAELDTSWELMPREDRLLLRRRGTRDLSLTAIRPNLFTREFGPWESLIPARLEFARDASGAVTHFTVSTLGDGQVVRGVRFVRKAPEP